MALNTEESFCWFKKGWFLWAMTVAQEAENHRNEVWPDIYDERKIHQLPNWTHLHLPLKLKRMSMRKGTTWLEFTYEAMVTAEQRLESENEKYFKEKDSENPRQGCE